MVGRAIFVARQVVPWLTRENFKECPILIVHQPDSDTTTAFSARLRGKTLTFAAANPEATELTDTQTHSRWDLYGHCIAGELKGSDLQPLIIEPEYWFAWSEFHPDTAIFASAPPESR